jgi:hypothetical protein
LAITIALIVFITPFKVYNLPYPISKTEQYIKEAAQWLENSKFKDRKIYFSDPRLMRHVNDDPFDDKRYKLYVPNVKQPQKVTSPGDLIFWDAHFSAHEGGAPLKRFLNNPYFRIIYKDYPGETVILYGNTFDTYTYIFERIVPDDPDLIPVDYTKNNEATNDIKEQQIIEYVSFEKNEKLRNKVYGIDNVRYDSSKQTHGKYSYYIDSSITYSPTIQFNPDELKLSQNDKLAVNINLWSVQKIDHDLHISLSFQNKRDKIIHYDAKPILCKESKWNNLIFEFNIPNKVKRVKKIKLFLHNKKHNFWLDEFLVYKKSQ